MRQYKSYAKPSLIVEDPRVQFGPYRIYGRTTGDFAIVDTRGKPNTVLLPVLRLWTTLEDAIDCARTIAVREGFSSDNALEYAGADGG